MSFSKSLKVAFIATFFLLYNTESFSQSSDVKTFVDTKKNFKEIKTGWAKGAFFNSSFTNVGLSNWAAGGQSSVSVGVTANTFAIYKDSNQTWENYLDMAWGSLRNGNAKNEDGSVNRFFKNEDKLMFLSKYGRTINSKLNYTSLLQFNSQFFQGFAPFNTTTNSRGQHISNILAPAFGLLSMGVDYKPTKYLSFYVSPATGKFTIVNEQRLADQGAFGVKAAEKDELGNILTPGQKFRAELGWYLNLQFNKEIMKNITMRSRLDLFTNYQTPDLTDVNWEVTINMKVNKYITTSIFTHLIYDDDIDTNPESAMVNPAIQFKHVLGVGFSYMIGDKL